MKKKEWKTVSIDKEVYNRLKIIQQEVMNSKGGDYVELGYVAESAILLSIDKLFDYLTKDE